MFDPGALWAYLSVFCLLLASGVGFPIPEEIPIVGAGVLVGHSSGQEMPPQIPYAASMFMVSPEAPFPANVPWQALTLEAHPQAVPAVQAPRWYTRSVPVRWWLMLPVCIIGVVVCDGMLYGSGRLWGPWLLEKKFVQRFLPPGQRQKIEKNFHDYGLWVLLFARLTPTIRAPIFIMAGVIRLPFSRFLLADGIYAIPGVSLLFVLGYLFGESFIQLIISFEGRVAAARPILILLLVAVVCAYLFFHFMRHPLATGDPRQEVPLIGDQVAEKLGHAEKKSSPDHQSSSKTGKPTQSEAPSRDGKKPQDGEPKSIAADAAPAPVNQTAPAVPHDVQKNNEDRSTTEAASCRNSNEAVQSPGPSPNGQVPQNGEAKTSATDTQPADVQQNRDKEPPQGPKA